MLNEGDFESFSESEEVCIPTEFTFSIVPKEDTDDNRELVFIELIDIECNVTRLAFDLISLKQFLVDLNEVESELISGLSKNDD